MVNGSLLDRILVSGNGCLDHPIRSSRVAVQISVIGMNRFPGRPFHLICQQIQVHRLVGDW